MEQLQAVAFSIFLGSWLVLIAFSYFQINVPALNVGGPSAGGWFGMEGKSRTAGCGSRVPVHRMPRRIGEKPMALWLTVTAVNAEKWKEQALATASSVRN